MHAGGGGWEGPIEAQSYPFPPCCAVTPKVSMLYLAGVEVWEASAGKEDLNPLNPAKAS